MNQSNHCPRVLVLLSISLVTAWAAYGSGWNDYVFDLPSGFYVMRANAYDIHIYRKKEGDTIQNVTKWPGVGPLFEIAIDDHFIFAKNRERPAGAADRPDPSIEFWTIIGRDEPVVYGPFSEAEFNSKVAELGIVQPIPWKPLRKAFKEAIRDGRANPGEVDTALAGQIMFLVMSWILFTPAFLLAAVPAALVIRRRKSWTFSKSFVYAWLGVTLITFALVTTPLVCRWVYMRFL